MRVVVDESTSIRPGSYGTRCQGDILSVPSLLFDVVKRISRAPESDHQAFCENLEAAAAFVMMSLCWSREDYDRAQAELHEQLRAHGQPFLPVTVPGVVLGALPPKKEL